MRAEDMGINPDTGSHSTAFSEAEAAMMAALADHIGKEEKISAPDLALKFRQEMNYLEVSYGERQRKIGMWKRDVRYLVNHLVIDHDQAIMSKAGTQGGYWIAANKSEMDQFYSSFRKRGMTGLVKASRGKKAVMVSMVKQLAFEWEDLKGIKPALVRPYEYESAPMSVVTTFLDKMTRSPEKFDHEIRLLRDKFGKVLMPKEDFSRIQRLSRELAGVLERVS